MVGPLGAAAHDRGDRPARGHADIIRETIDGATFYPLLAASEGWETAWLKPWKVRNSL